MDRPNLESIKARAQAADKAICAVAQNANHFRMSVPPQPDDTDMLVTGLAREDVPALIAYIEELEEGRDRLHQLVQAAGGMMWYDELMVMTPERWEALTAWYRGRKPQEISIEPRVVLSNWPDPGPIPDEVREGVLRGAMREARDTWLNRPPVEFAHPYPSLDNLEEINLFETGIDEEDMPEAGDTVHYVLRGLEGEYPEGAHRPATVIEVRSTPGGNGPGVEVITLDLHVFNQLGAFIRLDVTRSSDATPGTWHWPE
jgi:hypothetical protein